MTREPMPLYIATPLPAMGNTGVQTHTNICSDLAKQGAFADVQLVTPYGAHKLIRGPLRRFIELLRFYNEELAIVCGRHLQCALLYNQLRSRLALGSGKAVIYAQDPLSAKAALRVKRCGYSVQIVLAVHFNISEAWEAVQRGVAREGGLLWQSLTNIEREVLPAVDRIIFVSRFMRSTVLNRVPNAANIPNWVVPNTVRDPDPITDLDPTRDLITIGTIEPRKHQVFLVRVLSEAIRLGHDYTMTIVGDGGEKSQLMNLVHELHLTDYVRFTGSIPNAADLISHHKLYVHASVMESFGIVLVEALARGKPVLAAPVGGIPEIFTHGVEGFYWNLQEPSVAAKLIIGLLANRELYAKMATAAFQRYRRDFSPRIVGPALIDAILGTASVPQRTIL